MTANHDGNDPREPPRLLSASGEILGAQRSTCGLSITDVTLREGQEAGIVSFDDLQALELGMALQASGVGTIQVGYPGRSERDAQMTRLLASELASVRIEGIALPFRNDWASQIDACADAGATSVLLSFPAPGVDHERGGLDVTQAAERVSRSVAHAVNAGLVVGVAVRDTTRIELALLRRLWAAAATAGAARVTIADSSGLASPDVIDLVVREALSVGDVAVGVHCHNDLGLAVANTLAGARAGATVLDAAVNGIGERAGNAALEELTAALEFAYGIRSAVRLEDLRELSLKVAEAAGVTLAPWKPVTGSAVSALAPSLPKHARRAARPDAWGIGSGAPGS